MSQLTDFLHELVGAAVPHPDSARALHEKLDGLDEEREADHDRKAPSGPEQASSSTSGPEPARSSTTGPEPARSSTAGGSTAVDISGLPPVGSGERDHDQIEDA